MKQDKAFISVVSMLLLSLSIGIFIRGKNEISIVENRKLEYFPSFSMASFFDTSFQTGIENAFVDQIPTGEKIKEKYNLFKNKNLNYAVHILKSLEGETKISIESGDKDSNYVTDNTIAKNFNFQLEITPRGNDYLEINQTNHLAYMKKDIEESKRLFKLKADSYDKLLENYPRLSYHFYYIESDHDIDFVNGKIDHDMIQSFYSYLNPKIKKSALYLNQPSEFQKYFYRTDHHWNTEGQLEGYKSIIRNLKGEDEALLDIKTVDIRGVRYNGYQSRKINDYEIYDEFKILVADLAKHETYINGKKAVYGKKKDYVNGNFEKMKALNYYGDANGGDFGVVKYDFHNKSEKNLLVFVDSFSNPIKEFIASHYNNTYFIDLRDYESAYGKKFDFGDFVEENKIDQVLFMGYHTFYTKDMFSVTD